MKQLKIEDEYILYFIKQSEDGVTRRNIENRLPQVKSVNHRLRKMKKMNLIKSKEKSEHNHGNKKPTHVHYPNSVQIEKYENENGSLQLPDYAIQNLRQQIEDIQVVIDYLQSQTEAQEHYIRQVLEFIEEETEYEVNEWNPSD